MYACIFIKVVRNKYQEWATFELPFASVSKRVFVRNHSYGNKDVNFMQIKLIFV